MLKRILKKIRELFLLVSPDCPFNCGGKLYLEEYDADWDRYIWKCDRCSKEFI